MINVYEDSREFKAMGCHMAAWLYADEQFAAEPLAHAETLFNNEENRLSRFKADSELMRLNARAGEWIPVSDEIWELVQIGQELKGVTNGRFDFTLLRELQNAGYDQSFETMGMTRTQQPARSPKADSTPSRSQVLLHPDQQMVKLAAGTQLDFGGLAKGYTAQACRDFLHAFGPCLVDAGGDLTAGDGPGNWPGWPVAVSAPWGQAVDVGRIWLNNSTLATSGIDYRCWQQGNEQAHHIIDPTTGRPADTNLLTVSVLHADACTAEAWATATLVAGLDTGIALLEEQQIAAVLIDQDEQLHLTRPMKPLFQPAAEM